MRPKRRRRIISPSGKEKADADHRDFSPVHRTEKTGYGLEMERNWPYLITMSCISTWNCMGIGGHFPEEGQTLADLDLLFPPGKPELRNDPYHAGKAYGITGLSAPVPGIRRHKAVTSKEWTSLLMQIKQCAIYDVLILDIDEGIQDVYGVLRQCTEVMVPVANDPAARAKLFQFEEELRLLGYEDVKKKLVKKEPGAMIQAEQLHARILEELDMTREIEDEERRN